MPAGAEDLDKVTGDIILCFSDGTEKGIALGSTEEEACEIGEVVYKDNLGFLCRRWNWREADRTKIDSMTKRAVMVVEKVPEISDDSLQSILSEAKTRIESHLFGKCAIMILDTDHRVISLT